MKIKNLNSRFCLQCSILLIFIFSSCSLKKNFYVNGVCLWHSASAAKSEVEFSVPVKRKAPVSTKSISDGVWTPARVIPEEKLAQPNSENEIAEIIFSEHATPAPQKKIKSSFPAKLVTAKKNVRAQRPNPPQKHKISISTINTLATVSLLHIPLMLLAILLDLPALFWGFLVLGPLLAIISAILSRHRKGTWVAGVACGFWLVILAYGAVLIFL